MMRKVISLLVICHFSFLTSFAQDAVMEESVTDVVCDSRTHTITHLKEVTTILNEQGKRFAHFSCSCSKNNRLTNFKGLVTDGSGRIVRKIKESELKRTEYSQYLAIDDYQMYYDYTPPVYPVTITYEWTVESHDNLIEFPMFCPQTDYDISVKKAVYKLTAPKSMAVRHALQNISQTVNTDDSGKYTQVLTLELNGLSALKKEPYARQLRERLPIGYFVPTDFTYYGTEGSLSSWKDYGKWEYSLINGSEALPSAVCQELHQLTDGLKTDREKVEALYRRLGKGTRYVAVLLGIGGQRPESAASVCKSGFGDCKGLSNYMRAMLKEVGITSYYTTISTVNRRLLKDFASVGQMNHVILEVPLQDDTLWLECTNPQLPMGYVHEDIAGHDAIEVSESGGRLVRLPAYADSLNRMYSQVRIGLEGDGSAKVTLTQKSSHWQYEQVKPLLTMDQKDRQRVLLRMMRVPQAEISQMDISEQQAEMTLQAEVQSQKYANATGQRLFVPVCPLHQGYSAPIANSDRQEDIFMEMGYLDEDDIILTIPDGYEIEAMPKNLVIDKPFGSFAFMVVPNGKEIRIMNRLLMKSGTFDKSQYPELTTFIKNIAGAYGQKIVLKKQ